MQIEISGIAIEVTKKNIKNIHLRVKPDGSVTISAPKSCSLEVISSFAHSKLDWIKKHRERFMREGEACVSSYGSGDTLLLFGEKYVLDVTEGTRFSLELEGKRALLCTPVGADLARKKRFINEWYRTKLKQKLSYYLPKWEQLTGLYSSSWQIKNMSTRWGTCNTRTRKIWLNLQLAKVPERCLWYVILHELAHLKEHGHGPRFESILDRHMPDWRAVKKELNAFSELCR